MAGGRPLAHLFATVVATIPEAAVKDGWYKYVGLNGAIVGMNGFGESAPAKELFEYFGFTVDKVVEAVKSVV